MPTRLMMPAAAIPQALIDSLKPWIPRQQQPASQPASERAARKRSVVVSGGKLPYYTHAGTSRGSHVPSCHRFVPPCYGRRFSRSAPSFYPLVPSLPTLHWFSFFFIDVDPGSWSRQLKIFGFTRGLRGIRCQINKKNWEINLLNRTI